MTQHYSIKLEFASIRGQFQHGLARRRCAIAHQSLANLTVEDQPAAGFQQPLTGCTYPQHQSFPIEMRHQQSQTGHGVTGQLAAQLVGQLVGQLAGQLAGQLVGQIARWPHLGGGEPCFLICFVDFVPNLQSPIQPETNKIM